MILAGVRKINGKRQLVIVSGYYGYGNVGDEAILETIVCELKKIISAEDIVVLSANPEATKEIYGVNAVDRFNFAGLAALLSKATLFISGGGGLFQDTRSIGSPAYYGLQIFLAKAFNVPVYVFAQGIGPLRSSAARALTKAALLTASTTTVRDYASHSLLESWFVDHATTADPVWCLGQGNNFKLGSDSASISVGLSLRPSPNFSDELIEDLASAMNNALPASAKLTLLPMQTTQDLPTLNKFLNCWQKLGRQASIFDSTQITKPSQWLSVIASLDFLIGMRLHALIMAIASHRAVIGINYDPKVQQLLEDCNLPMLNLTKEEAALTWEDVIKSSLASRSDLATQAKNCADTLRDKACQNFTLLARILK